MFLIVGLGNPGSSYEKTRHNAGFMLVDRLAAQAGGVFGRSSRKSLASRVWLHGEPVLLAKPQTFMNLSGEAVRELLLRTGAGLSRTLVVYDEIALPLGTIRIRKSGSAAGHKGMISIIDALGTQEVPRMRLGICGEGVPEDKSKYVLARFRKSEAEALELMLARAAEAVQSVLEEGFDRAMALYNHAKGA